MPTNEVMDRVRGLRAEGRSPKQIARELGMKPAEVMPLLRQLAGEHRLAKTHQPLPEPSERRLVACLVTPGWSAGLGLAAGAILADDPGAGEFPGGEGLIGVVVARAERGSRVTVCGYLVDVYCLGVKNTMGPLAMGESAVDGFVGRFFGGFDQGAAPAPLGLGQHLVHGAVAYARSLGFEPHPDFADTAPYLGEPAGPCPITFGRDGSPFYVSGPNDDPRAVIDLLEVNAGTGNYQFIAGL